jgi:hypothetical protein
LFVEGVVVLLGDALCAGREGARERGRKRLSLRREIGLDISRLY